MKVLVAERGTEEWRRAHRGKVSASDAVAVLARPRTKRRNALIERLVLNLEGEGLETEEFPAPWTQQHEEELRAAVVAYRKHSTFHVEPCGLVAHDDLPWLVASPHALVGDAGLLHVRVRYSLRTLRLRGARVDGPTLARTQLALYVCGRAWCDISDFWNGRGVVSDRLMVRRIDADKEYLHERVLPRLLALWSDTASAMTARRVVGPL